MVVVIDYKAGNIGSVINMLRKIGVQATISDRPSDILNAEKLILPGVGAFDYGMKKLQQSNLIDPLNQRVLEGKVPILGICLGAQLMCRGSEEGSLPGLGWIDGFVKKIPGQLNGAKYAVPHMTWDTVRPSKSSNLHVDWPTDARFYFVHSYYIECKNKEDVLFENCYGIHFHSAFEKENIVGVQFHPEKSHKFGKQLFKNFINRY